MKYEAETGAELYFYLKMENPDYLNSLQAAAKKRLQLDEESDEVTESLSEAMQEHLEADFTVCDAAADWIVQQAIYEQTMFVFEKIRELMQMS